MDAESTGIKEEYDGGFSQVAATGSWSDVADILGEKTGFVPMEDNGKLKEGDYRVIEDDPGVRGVFLEPQIFGSEDMTRNQRYSGGFFFRNSNGDPVELKYRFSDELREYPELVHMHNVPELYVADGNFQMDVADEVVDASPESFTSIEIEDECFVVPAGLFHGITSRSPDSNLVVARGDPSLNHQYVGKWDYEGNQLYNHFDQQLQKPPTVT